MPADNATYSDLPEGMRPLLLKVPEACALLRISRSQLYVLLKSGDLKGMTVGPGQRRISYAECEAYVARKMAEQNAA